MRVKEGTERAEKQRSKEIKRKIKIERNTDKKEREKIYKTREIFLKDIERKDQYFFFKDRLGETDRTRKTRIKIRQSEKDTKREKKCKIHPQQQEE